MTDEDKPPVSVSAAIDRAEQGVFAIVANLRARIAELEAKTGAWDDRYSGSAKEIEAHTIERCAQVVREWPVRSPNLAMLLLEIETAILALKDKP